MLKGIIPLIEQRSGQWLPCVRGRLHRNKTSNRNTILMKDKGCALVADPIDAIGKIASCLGHANDHLPHKIRLSDFTHFNANFF